jgi:hypothetical protein
MSKSEDTEFSALEAQALKAYGYQQELLGKISSLEKDRDSWKAIAVNLHGFCLNLINLLRREWCRSYGHEQDLIELEKLEKSIRGS